MAKVIRVFRERFHGMKRYNVGDDYPETDEARVRYLVHQGYLQEPDKLSQPDNPKRKRGADADGDTDG